jgi:hypothetical protein
VWIYIGDLFHVWRIPSSGMWRCVDLVWTDVSEEHITSIFMVDKNPRVMNQREQVSAVTCSRWFLARGFFCPEDEGDTFLRNVGSRKIYTRATSQKTAFCIVTAVKTSDLTYCIIYDSICVSGKFWTTYQICCVPLERNSWHHCSSYWPARNIRKSVTFSVDNNVTQQYASFSIVYYCYEKKV